MTTNGTIVPTIGRTRRAKRKAKKREQKRGPSDKTEDEQVITGDKEELWSQGSNNSFSINLAETEENNGISREVLLSVVLQGVHKNVMCLLNSGTSQSLMNKGLIDRKRTIKSKKAEKREIKAAKFSTKAVQKYDSNWYKVTLGWDLIC